MVLRKLIVPTVFAVFVAVGVAAPVEIRTTGGFGFVENSALAKKDKKEKKEKGEKASKRSNEEMEGVGKKGKGKGMEKGKRKKGK